MPADVIVEGRLDLDAVLRRHEIAVEQQGDGHVEGAAVEYCFSAADVPALVAEIRRLAGENELLQRVIAEQRREMDGARVIRSPLKDPTRPA